MNDFMTSKKLSNLIEEHIEKSSDDGKTHLLDVVHSTYTLNHLVNTTGRWDTLFELLSKRLSESGINLNTVARIIIEPDNVRIETVNTWLK